MFDDKTPIAAKGKVAILNQQGCTDLKVGPQQPHQNKHEESVHLVAFKKLNLSTKTRALSYAGRVCKIYPNEAAVLTALIKAGGEVVTHDNLCRAVEKTKKNDAITPEPVIVQTSVTNLRKKMLSIGCKEYAILNKPECGYKISDSE
jgi:DNA-binding response OmpR family regulator